MGSRGRGRGRGGSFWIPTEPLGFGKGEAMLPLVLQPPAKYPQLDYKPHPVELNKEMSYLVEIKRDYAEHLRASPCHIQSVATKRDIERYSDRYQDMVNQKVCYNERYNWQKLPAELKAKTSKRKVVKATKSLTAKKKKEVDIDSKLNELEQKESTQRSDDEEDEKGENEEEEKDSDEPAEEEEIEVDEEMDDGTDYLNNYFDNGEGYDDEDDNLDDGPIY